MKYLGDKMKFNFDTFELFNKFKTQCLRSGLFFHTYTTDQEKIIAVILKGLPKFDSSEIIKDLQAHDLNPLSCIEIQKDPKSSYPIYKLTFPAERTLQHVRKVSSLFLIRIYWDKYNGSRPFIQCFRCQARGHTSKNCNKEFKYVKCAGSHNTRECKKTLDTLAKCVNCGGSHTASYTKCPVLLRYLDKKSNPKVHPNPIITPQPQVISPQQTNANLSKSYTQALKENKPQPQPQPQHTSQKSLAPAHEKSPSEFASVFQTVASLVR